MRKILNKVLSPFGYEIAKAAPDAFRQQQLLLETVAKPTIFDVGAHSGDISRIYRRLIPSALIYAFEPFPESCQTLKTSFHGDGKMHAFQIAISDRTGKMKLNANLSAATNSLLATDAAGAEFWGQGLLETTGQIEVETISLDHFCSREGIEIVDLLKLDIQGAEFLALQGGETLLEDQRIKLVYTEVIMMPTYEGQHKFHEICQLMDRKGYDLFNMFNFVSRGGMLLQADVLFIGRTFRKQLNLFTPDQTRITR